MEHCPVCKEPMPALSKICPVCGYIATQNDNTDNLLDTLVDKMENCLHINSEIKETRHPGNLNKLLMSTKLTKDKPIHISVKIKKSKTCHKHLLKNWTQSGKNEKNKHSDTIFPDCYSFLVFLLLPDLPYFLYQNLSQPPNYQ